MSSIESIPVRSLTLQSRLVHRLDRMRLRNGCGLLTCIPEGTMYISYIRSTYIRVHRS